MKPSPQHAVTFLRLIHPGRPWVVTAIPLEGKGLPVKTFGEDTAKECEEWISKYNNDNYNIYFSVNEPRGVLTKKAKETDIVRVHYLHVDLDPRPGEDLQGEQRRLLELVSNPPEPLPPPTFVLSSGGGMQGFWKLETPIEIGGAQEKADEAKRYNMQLEQLLGADACHNVDRIMRLPGTINWPDAKKQRKNPGRGPAKATLLVCEAERVYPLAKFTPAPETQDHEAGFAPSSTTVTVSGNLKRFDSVQHVADSCTEKPLPDWCMRTIVNGDDPLEPGKWESRSEALFAVSCELVRCGLDDDQIYSILTDPDFAISESVLDKSNPDRYAKRQIERGREDAINPWLRKLNERHAVIANLGGKCRVIEEVFDPALRRMKLTRQSFEDFRNAYMPWQVEVARTKEGQPVYKRLGNWWLEQPQRRQYRTLVFAPGQEIPDAYNLWQGFGCRSIPGNNHEMYLDHVRSQVCDGNEELYDYVVGWLANAVQNPASSGQVAIVLRGRKGVGKGEFARHFGKLWGRHYMQVTDAKHLVGNFNAHLRDVCVLFADEAFFAGDKMHESTLKSLITEATLAIEPKGVDVEIQPNYLHVIMASNSNWVVPATEGERRFLVLDVSDSKMQDHDYFQQLSDLMESGGYESLLNYLLTYDLSNFNLRKVPQTAALQEQKELNLSSEEDWWLGKLETGHLARDGSLSWTSPVKKDYLFRDYIEYNKLVGVPRRSSSPRLGRFLRQVCPGVRNRQRQETIVDEWTDTVKKVRSWYYEFPPLAECRARWDARFGAREWPNPDAEDEDEQPNNPLV